MFYDYECEICKTITTVNCKISEMKRSIDCPCCGGNAIKLIEAPMLIGVSSSKDRINKEQKRKNVEAGHLQHGSHKSCKPSKK